MGGADYDARIKGTCRVPDVHSLEDCKEFCSVDPTCLFVYFEPGGCHLYRHCEKSRRPTNMGTNLWRIAKDGSAVVKYNIWETFGPDFCKSTERCTCDEPR